MFKERPAQYTIGEKAQGKTSSVGPKWGQTLHISGRASRLLWLKWNEGKWGVYLE